MKQNQGSIGLLSRPIEAPRITTGAPTHLFRRSALRVLNVALLLIMSGMGLKAYSQCIPSQAYSSTDLTGTQSWSGPLGLDFDVNSAITINQLGAFAGNATDVSQGSQSGANSGIRVAIFTRGGTPTIVSGTDVVITTGTASGGYIMVPISPVLLAPGQYSLVAIGFNAVQMNGNVGQGSTAPTTNTGSGAISFVGSSRYDSGPTFQYPSIIDGGPAARYLTATFEFCSASPVHNVERNTYFTTIQAAINDPLTVAGDHIEVIPGVYDEQVLVNKEVSIKGIGSTKPIVTFTGTPTGKLTLFDVSKPNITIENFDLKVDLAKLKSGIIASATNISNLTIKDNLIEAIGSSNAVSLSGYGDRNAISINYGGSTNYRVASGGVTGVSVTGNTVSGVANDGFGMARYFRSGVSMDEGAGAFTGNTFQSINQDVLARFGGHGAITVSNNNLNGGGVELSDMNAGTGTLSVTGNTFDASFANVAAAGTAVLRLKNNYNATPTVVTGNTFNNHEWGVSLENYNSVTLHNNNFTPLASSTTYHHITVNTKSINTNSANIVQVINGGTFTSNTFNAATAVGGTALGFYNHDNDATALSGSFVLGTAGNENNFNSGISRFIYLDHQTGASNTASFPNYGLQFNPDPATITTMAPWSANLNGVNNKYDVGSGLELPSAMSTANLFALEDKIQHKIDLGTLGFVTVKVNNDYVTTNSFVSPATTVASIQRGVDAASNGFTVNVGPGSFTENVNVNKEVLIDGSGQALTTVFPALSSPNSCGGSLCPTASNIFLVQANNVTIQNLTADGDNTGLTSGIVSGGADIDARNGIITDHTLGVFNNLNVNHATVKNIYLRGIYASSGGSFTFDNNIVSNVQASTSSIGIFNFGGAGSITNNTISDASDAIASNHSTGTTYTGNTVTNSGSGIHTDNNGDGGGTGDLIENNQVSNSIAGGYGIWVFVPYKAVTVRGNAISNVDVGLANAGQGAVVTTLFMRNTVDGQNKVNSIGVYQTTSQFSFGTNNVSGTYTNNYIVNNDDGFYLEYQSGKTNSITANENSITGNTPGVTLGTGPAAAGALVNNFNCNWWGSTNPTTVSTNVGAPVNYTPWLSNGADNDMGTAGFQATPNSCSGCPSGNIVQNVNTSKFYCSIQDAINDPLTLNGHTISVGAGTYAENISVTKSLTILGPNANVDPCSGSRTAEAIILPAVTETSLQASTSGTIFRLGTNAGHINVAIKGFTLDGHNPLLTGGRTLNGVEIHTGAGIVNSTGSFDTNPGGYDVTMTVQNNIIQNLERYGVLVDGVPSRTAMAGTDVSHNKIDNLPSGNVYTGGRGRGIAFEENHYGTATFNCISRVNVGWQDDNYDLPSPGAATIVSNNTISSYHRGIFHNLQYSNASNATISNNTISAESSNNSGTDFGVEIASIQTGVGATVTGNNITGKTYGILLWGNPTTSTINVSGGTLTNNVTGILATETDPQFGASAPSTYGISNLTITGGSTGLQVDGNASVSSLGTVAFSGQSGDYIKMSNGAMNGQTLNATTCTFAGQTGATATLAQNYAIEDKITHKIDLASLGFVLVKANNDFVTPNSFASPNTAGSIQRGVDAASNGFTVNVAAGTFNESVLVNKQVSILGAQSNVLAKGRSGLESILDPNNATGHGFNIVTDNVTIDGFSITNSAAYPSTSSERYGVVTITKAGPGNFTGIIVKNNIISRQFKAIDFNSTDNFEISHNWLHGEGDPYNYGCTWVASYGTSSTNGLMTDNDLDGYGSAIEIQGNLTQPVSNVTVSQNRSTGSQYVFFGLKNSSVYRNSVLNVTAGTHVYIGGGCTNSTFSENYFDNGTANGIKVVNQFGAGINSGLSISNNSITGHNTAGTYEILVDPSAYIDSLIATCNWFGTTNQPTVASKMSGPVKYTPYLTTGGDASAGTPGFQPSGTCTGSCNFAATASATDATCATRNDGSATVSSTTGGTGPYAYAWTPGGQTTQTASNLYSGNYSVVVTDLNGCQAPASATVGNANPLPVATITPSTPSFCSALTLTGGSASGGSVSNYAWSGPNSYSSMSQSINLYTSNSDGNYNLTIDSSGCISAPATYNYQKQNMISSYNIFAIRKVDLYSNNKIVNGSIGVNSSSTGQLFMQALDSLVSPGAFVKAPYMSIAATAYVPASARYTAPAVATLPAMNYAVPATSGANATVTTNTTLSGNYYDITIGTGLTVTVTGNSFHAITVGKNSKVTFTAPVVNAYSISTSAGVKLVFNQNTEMRVARSVRLSTGNIVNPSSKIVTFYVGDLNATDEFRIDEGGTIRANAYVPDLGTITVNSSATAPTIMTGKYIGYIVTSIGKNVTWNSYDCAAPPATILVKQVQEPVISAIETISGFDVRVAPNPSNGIFTFNIVSESTEAAFIRIMDVSGRLILSRTIADPGMPIEIGQEMAAGNYFAEIIQGSNKKVLKLLKVE